MQKLRTVIRKIVSYVKRKKTFFVPLGCFVLGIGLGMVLMAALADADDTKNTSKTSYGNGSYQRMRGNEDRLKIAYERSLERIERDVQNKRLTEAQAQKVREKIESLYASAAETKDDADSGKQALALRQELRVWAEAEDVSIKYFTGLW